jgi:hypothetical protein
LKRKKKEWKAREIREKERAEELQKQREVWQQKEQELLKQIADLQAQLELARHQTLPTKTNSLSSATTPSVSTSETLTEKITQISLENNIYSSTNSHSS